MNEERKLVHHLYLLLEMAACPPTVKPITPDLEYLRPQFTRAIREIVQEEIVKVRNQLREALGKE